MDSTGSFLKTFLERLAAYVDAEEAQKYGDAWVIQHILGPAVSDVMNRLAMNGSNLIMNRITYTTVGTQAEYTLPPGVREILFVGTVDSRTGLPLLELKPRALRNYFGPGWSISGNALRFDPLPPDNMNLEVWYIHNGDMLLHYDDQSAGALADSSFTLAATPALGLLDKRPNAYKGLILRVFGTSVTEERMITAYNPSTRTCTLNLPMDSLANGSYNYEIAPFISYSLYEAVVVRAALKLATMRNASQAKQSSLRIEYASHLKSAYDSICEMQARTGKSFQRNTVDNKATYRM